MITIDTNSKEPDMTHTTFQDAYYTARRLAAAGIRLQSPQPITSDKHGFYVQIWRPAEQARDEVKSHG